jgi:hypothetical protein
MSLKEQNPLGSEFKTRQEEGVNMGGFLMSSTKIVMKGLEIF